MNTNMRLVALILILIAPTWAVAEKFICIAEAATGFYYNDDSNTWENTKINVDSSKYLVSFTEKTVSQFGKEGYMHDECFFIFIEETKVFFCNDGFGEFQMGEKSMKYLKTSPYYDYAMGENSGTPNIQRGTCSKF